VTGSGKLKPEVNGRREPKRLAINHSERGDKLNTKKLKIKMLERMSDDSFNGELARVLNCSYATACSRMNRNSDFTREEVQKLKEAYSMTAEEVDEIFFKKDV